jgi:MarR family 2-MHQ and catechol resistance regulon transcriptional repressor
LFGVEDPAVAESVAAYVKLMRAAHAVLARIEPALAAEGLTPTQLGVLEAVLHKGPLTHGELGRKVLTSAGNCTDVVDKLAARGFVERVPVATDKRKSLVALTATGRALIERVFPPHAHDIAAAMSGLSGAELAILSDLLRRLGRTAEATARSRTG